MRLVLSVLVNGYIPGQGFKPDPVFLFYSYRYMTGLTCMQISHNTRFSFVCSICNHTLISIF